MTADGTYRPGARVTTAAEMDALPIGSVVRNDSRAIVAERISDVHGAVIGNSRPFPWLDHWSAGSRLTVLFRPDAPQPAPTDDPAVVQVVARILALGSDITPDMEALANGGKWQALWTNLRNDLRAAVSDLRAALAAAGAGEAQRGSPAPASAGSSGLPLPAPSSNGGAVISVAPPAGEAVDREALAGVRAASTLLSALSETLDGYESPSDIDAGRVRDAVQDIAQALDAATLLAARDAANPEAPPTDNAVEQVARELAALSWRRFVPEARALAAVRGGVEVDREAVTVAEAVAEAERRFPTDLTPRRPFRDGAAWALAARGDAAPTVTAEQPLAAEVDDLREQLRVRRSHTRDHAIAHHGAAPWTDAERAEGLVPLGEHQHGPLCRNPEAERLAAALAALGQVTL